MKVFLAHFIVVLCYVVLQDTVSCNFTFDPNYMNVHEFNMTDDNIGQDLHILLTMGPTKNRAYPLHVLLRYNERPYPDEYDERWVYLEDSTLLDIFLPAGSLNGKMFVLAFILALNSFP